MIEIPGLGDDDHRMWVELMGLAEDAPAPWTLIGAQMVALHGWAAGRDPVRPSRDADLLVDVRAVTGGTERLSAKLLEAAYRLETVTPQGIGHRFVKDSLRIDILAPDGLGERTRVRTVAPARTMQVPGGTQALRRTRSFEIRTRSSRGTVPAPDILGAILVKVQAIAVDDQPDAQRQDVAFLLSLVADPDTLATKLKRTERSWLRRHPYFADPMQRCWRGIRDAEDGAIVYRRLAHVR